MLRYIFGSVVTVVGIVVAGIGFVDIPTQPAVLIALGIAFAILGIAILLTEDEEEV